MKRIDVTIMKHGMLQYRNTVGGVVCKKIRHCPDTAPPVRFLHGQNWDSKNETIRNFSLDMVFSMFLKCYEF